VGGVSGRPTREGTWSNPRVARCRGGGRHPVHGMAAPFAGSRRNAGLDRLVRSVEVSSSAGGLTGDKGCSSGAEEGNDVGSRQQSVGTRREGGDHRTRAKGTRPLLGPKARARRTWLISGGQKPSEARRSTCHRGRANLRKQEEPAPGTWGAGGARLVAYHRPSQGGRMVRQKRKAVAAVVPTRNRESGSKCPHVVAVAEVGRRRQASNTLVRSAPKRVAARVNGGLARGHRRR